MVLSVFLVWLCMSASRVITLALALFMLSQRGSFCACICRTKRIVVSKTMTFFMGPCQKEKMVPQNCAPFFQYSFICPNSSKTLRCYGSWPHDLSGIPWPQQVSCQRSGCAKPIHEPGCVRRLRGHRDVYPKPQCR